MAEHLTKLDWKFYLYCNQEKTDFIGLWFCFWSLNCLHRKLQTSERKNERILFFWGKSSRIKRNVSSRKRNKICENRRLKAGIFSTPPWLCYWFAEHCNLWWVFLHNCIIVKTVSWPIWIDNDIFEKCNHQYHWQICEKMQQKWK